MRYLNLFILGMIGLLLASEGVAQGIRYQTTTRVHLPGTTGDVVGAVAGLTGVDDVEETISIQGEQMRVDRGALATLYDLAARRVVTLHDEGAVCSFMSFDEIQRRIAQAQEEATEATGPSAGTSSGQADYDLAEVKLDFSVQPGGAGNVIDGYPTSITTFTFMADASAEARKLEEVDGSFVLVSDVGMAQGVAGYETVRAFQQRLAEEIGAAAQQTAGLQKLKEVLEGDSRMQVAMEQALEEQIRLDGVPLETTTYFVRVPQGLAYAPYQVRPEKIQKKKKISRFLKKAARKALNNEEEDPGPRQRTLFFITTTLHDFHTGPLGESLFMMPSHCQEVVAGSE